MDLKNSLEEFPLSLISNINNITLLNSELDNNLSVENDFEQFYGIEI